ncbi:ArsR/SmtB family transcription factor [Isachenkonia alkalipeptolytica]|uniref:Winged helix-turn-helix transcriptional regulator n=1 Tax=Isachenkonia alkalipeptolytica TaxID=2565777 RepID=A0AA44BCP2_9CLOT|nr:metalloregulator ArsR/SmtB family transcription factor [Isachenkonia alkalipeptolytica]NBG87118.1 winged helix-turn-helix transcriptional regulator [Isachenkonia alkalipeptolytica]
MKSLQGFLKLISEETRLRILMLLNEEALCVCELEAILEVPQPRVSKILSKYRDLGLVIDERKGKFIYYKLALKDPLHQAIVSTIKEKRETIEQLSRDYQRMLTKEGLLNACQGSPSELE